MPNTGKKVEYSGDHVFVMDYNLLDKNLAILYRCKYTQQIILLTSTQIKTCAHAKDVYRNVCNRTNLETKRQL